VNQLALFQGTRLCGANVADQSFGYLASISRHPACFQTAFETKRTMVTHYGMNGKPDSTSPAHAMGAGTAAGEQLGSLAPSTPSSARRATCHLLTPGDLFNVQM
jgi:hypothetical protein